MILSIGRWAGCSVLAFASAGAASAQTGPITDSSASIAAAAVANDPAQTTPTAAQTGAAAAPRSDEIGDIVVTANKRSQSINEVALTITAATGDALIQRGVSSTADLARVVPGLTAQPSPFNTPVYTLRGVGFYESTLSASPTVAVYTDEVALPFSAMTKAAALDVERVEVLKGPQGTLFGNNTTGGAINFVSAKPTDKFEAGFDGSYGRFNNVDLQGYVSGPLTDTIKGRVSGRLIRSDGWQTSITRAGDRIGAVRQGQGRVLLDWDASSKLRFTLNLNGWVDKSDSQAPQRIDTYISVPGNPQEAANRAYPYPNFNNRSADWSNNLPALRHDDYFVQGALRADYDLTNTITLTSITALMRYKTNSYSDYDGTARNIADNHTIGHINTFSQELRISGKTEGFNWVIGGNYETDRTFDRLTYFFGDSTTSQVGPFHMTVASNFTRQNVKTAAVFGNAEYEILPNLTLQAGARYTDSRRSFSGCTDDVPGGGVAETFEFIESIYRNPALPFVPIPQGKCVTFDADITPILDPLRGNLNEHNVSWRGGVNYKTPNRGLLYATISKGYKAGSFPTTSASSVSQYDPVKQESLVAYEVGFKQPIFDRAIQINGSAFYYDYSNKQLRGRVLDIVFGPLDALVQIPKSRVWGVEGEVSARPIDGLNLNVAATYLNTKIKEFTGYNNAGVLQSYAGSRFPYAPKLQVIADGQYDFHINDRFGAFLGSSLAYNSSTNGSIGDIKQLAMKSYALLDVRAGVKAADNRWRFQIWGRNITNTYYWANALQSQDVYLRFTGKPATYGATFTFRYR
jgi:iron complex outermembrane receptor protein